MSKLAISSSLTRALFVLSLLAALAVTAACTVGTNAEPSSGATFVDSDGDGAGDGVDTDGDGESDYTTPSCPTCTPGTDVGVCVDPLVDTNGDTIPDGIDLDCDGIIDIPLGDTSAGGGTTGGSGSGSGNGGTVSQTSCVSVMSINNDKRSIECTSDGTGSITCRCERNDQLVSTCTTTLASPCDMSYPAQPGENCCNF